jgi:hypothetical protein
MYVSHTVASIIYTFVLANTIGDLKMQKYKQEALAKKKRFFLK